MRFQLCQTKQMNCPNVPRSKHVARDRPKMCLHVIYTRLRPGHLSVRVGDSSWRSEETVKKLISNSMDLSPGNHTEAFSRFRWRTNLVVVSAVRLGQPAVALCCSFRPLAATQYFIFRHIVVYDMHCERYGRKRPVISVYGIKREMSGPSELLTLVCLHK